MEEMKGHVNTFFDGLQVETIYESILVKIDQIIKEKDYSRLLKICSLKKEISRGLADRYLDISYEQKAIEHIQADRDLQIVLKEKYFSPLLK